MANENGRRGKKIYISQPMEVTNKDTSMVHNILDPDLSWSIVAGNKRKNPITTLKAFSVLTNPNSSPDKTMRSGSICLQGSTKGITR